MGFPRRQSPLGQVIQEFQKFFVTPGAGEGQAEMPSGPGGRVKVHEFPQRFNRPDIVAGFEQHAGQGQVGFQAIRAQPPGNFQLRACPLDITKFRQKLSVLEAGFEIHRRQLHHHAEFAQGPSYFTQVAQGRGNIAVGQMIIGIMAHDVFQIRHSFRGIPVPQQGQPQPTFDLPAV